MNGLLRTLVATGDRVRPHGLALGVSAALALLLQAPMAHAQKQQSETSKSSDTSLTVHGTVPSSTNVDVSDNQMKNAARQRVSKHEAGRGGWSGACCNHLRLARRKR